MFPDQERSIFSYAVRDDTRFADPLALRRNLLRASNGEFDQVARDSRDRPDRPDGMGGIVDQGPEDFGQIMQRENAKEKLYGIICFAFGLTPFDPATGEGITEAETTAVLGRFLGFLEKKGKQSANLPGSSAAMASLPASSSTTPPTLV